MNAIFVKKEQLADDIYTFWFRPHQTLRYVAGQFVELDIPHHNADDRGTKRWFTLSSSPTEPNISVTTRIMHKNPSSFKQALSTLEKESIVAVSEAMGDFVLPKNQSTPLVFVIGGIGITPLRSMAKWLLDTDQTRNISLHYYVKTKSDAVFLDLFRTIKMKTNVHIDTHYNKSELPPVAALANAPLIYVSGPEKMVSETQKIILETGHPPSKLVTDSFPGYTTASG